MRHPIFELPPCTPYVLLALLTAPLAWFLLRTLTSLSAETLGEIWQTGRRRQREFWDAGQSPGARMCAEKLAGRRMKNRIEAVHIMILLDDATVVPALIRAAERYEKDVPFLFAVIEALRHFDDPRALPLLRRLSADRHYGLMQAARQGIEKLEPRQTLLRASAAPAVSPDSLLRPAAAPAATDPQTLLRAHSPQNA